MATIYQKLDDDVVAVGNDLWAAFSGSAGDT